MPAQQDEITRKDKKSMSARVIGIGVGLKAAAGVSSRHARDASQDLGRSHGRSAGNRLLWAAKHRFYRAGESDRPTWRGSAGTTHVGHGEARSTTAGPPGMVA